MKDSFKFNQKMTTLISLTMQFALSQNITVAKELADKIINLKEEISKMYNEG